MLISSSVQVTTNLQLTAYDANKCGANDDNESFVELPFSILQPFDLSHDPKMLYNIDPSS